MKGRRQVPKLSHLLIRPDIGIRTLNEPEILVAEHLIADGYRLLKRGWPDFLAVRGDDVRFIEVKPHAWRRLKPTQQDVANILYRRYGIVVEKLSPDIL